MVGEVGLCMCWWMGERETERVREDTWSRPFCWPRPWRWQCCCPCTWRCQSLVCRCVCASSIAHTETLGWQSPWQGQQGGRALTLTSLDLGWPLFTHTQTHTRTHAHTQADRQAGRQTSCSDTLRQSYTGTQLPDYVCIWDLDTGRYLKYLKSTHFTF